jgi:hypothetical protein
MEHTAEVNKLKEYLRTYIAKGKSKEAIIKFGDIAEAVLNKKTDYSVFQEFAIKHKFGTVGPTPDQAQLAMALILGKVAKTMEN